MNICPNCGEYSEGYDPCRHCHKGSPITEQDIAKMKKKRAYKIEVLNHQLNPIIVREFKEILGCLENFMGDCLIDCEDDIDSVYTVTPIMMTDKEMAKLPEWAGP